MRKGIHFATIVLALILSIGLAGGAISDVAAQFQQADQLTNESKYEQAESIYSQIATEHPGTADGLRAQQKLTTSYVAWGKQADAQASLENLLTRYSQHELLPEAVTKVGDAYRKAENYTKAAELHRYVIDHWPENEFAFWSQMDLVICSEALRDLAGAQAAFEKLRTQYSGHKLMPKAICFLGDDYRRRGQHARALELYAQVLSNWPKAEDAFWSQMGLAVSSMLLGDIDAADAAITKLHVDFSEDNRISIAACLLGDEYRKSGHHAKACELYQYVLDKHPDSEHAFWAQMNLVLSNIHLACEDAAQEALGKLFAYSAKKDDRLPYAIRTVADEYRKTQKYDEAFELYEYVVTNHGGTQEALWSQMNLAIAKIKLGDPNADPETQRLLADYSKNPGIPAALCWVADQYRKSGSHDKARELYQHVLDNYPDAEHALWSQMGLALSDIRTGQIETAQGVDAVIDRLILDFNDQSDLAAAVFQIGEEYYNRAMNHRNEGRDNEAGANFTKAISIWARIMGELPVNLPHTVHAWYFSGDSNRHMGEYANAIECYRKVVDNWPDYEYAWGALFKVGRTYEEMVKSGLLPESEAEPMIEVAYQELLEKYPSCRGAIHAQYWLDHRK